METNVKKVSVLDIPEISKKITAGVYHIHENFTVSKDVLKHWMRRGYNPHKIGIVHVRYPENPDIRYQFPLYMWIIEEIK